MFGYCLRLVLLVDLVAASALRLIRCAWWLISVCFRMMRVSCDFLFVYSCGFIVWWWFWLLVGLVAACLVWCVWLIRLGTISVRVAGGLGLLGLL